MTTTEAIDTGSELIHLLTQQRLLYRQLKELAAKQSSLVEQADPEMLLRVLADRQRLIDKLAAIDRRLRPIRKDWQRVAGSLPEAQRVEAQGLIEAVRQILGEIITQDRQDSEALSSRQQATAEQIRSASAGRRMHQAYSQSAPAPQSRFDAKGL
jgi:hypothetical protein